jgi:hypothetical protein
VKAVDPALLAAALLEPWFGPPDQPEVLDRELEREVGPGHVLFGRRMHAVAQRQGCDDVLFVSDDDGPQIVAVVHLTWAGGREISPQWPSARTFDSLDRWLEEDMRVDHEYYK